MSIKTGFNDDVDIAVQTQCNKLPKGRGLRNLGFLLQLTIEIFETNARSVH